MALIRLLLMSQSFYRYGAQLSWAATTVFAYQTMDATAEGFQNWPVFVTTYFLMFLGIAAFAGFRFQLPRNPVSNRVIGWLTAGSTSPFIIGAALVVVHESGDGDVGIVPSTVISLVSSLFSAACLQRAEVLFTPSPPSTRHTDPETGKRESKVWSGFCFAVVLILVSISRRRERGSDQNANSSE